MSTLEFLESKGIRVEYCPVDQKGRVKIDELENMVNEEAFLICVLFANNETGVVQDISTISRIAKKHGVLVFSDSVQALGKLEVDVKKLGVDYASFSAHKIHGPKGIGGLFIKRGSPFIPLIHGGHQEYGIRAGTESLHNIAGFAAACTDIEEMLTKSEDIRRLKQYLVDEISKIKGDVVVNSPQEECLPNTVSITFSGVNNAVFMAMLDHNGISVSAGSACNTQDDKPSHVLKSIPERSGAVEAEA
jgi:cysteine desulfurase